MKKQNGITLISLVVTIIILIILAGISVNLILGQDGIINKAKEAKQNIEYAQIEEQEQLNEVYEYLELGTIGTGSSDNKIEEIALKYQTLKNEYDELQEDYNNQNAEYTNFKTTIANAITEVGVETAVNADAETMSSNIRSLSGGLKTLTIPFTLLNYDGSGVSSDFKLEGLNIENATVTIKTTLHVSGNFIILTINGAQVASFNSPQTQTYKGNINSIIVNTPTQVRGGVFGTLTVTL